MKTNSKTKRTGLKQFHFRSSSLASQDANFQIQLSAPPFQQRILCQQRSRVTARAVDRTRGGSGGSGGGGFRFPIALNAFARTRQQTLQGAAEHVEFTLSSTTQHKQQEMKINNQTTKTTKQRNEGTKERRNEETKKRRNKANLLGEFEINCVRGYGSVDVMNHRTATARIPNVHTEQLLRFALRTCYAVMRFVFGCLARVFFFIGVI